jgi:hypothetical protein
LSIAHQPTPTTATRKRAWLRSGVFTLGAAVAGVLIRAIVLQTVNAAAAVHVSQAEHI